MMRMRRLRSQPCSTKSTASQSSKFGMGRPRSLVAEVAGGLDDAAAEDHLPEAVHGDAGGERMVRAGDPAGEIEAGRRSRCAPAAAARRAPGADFLAGLVVGTADQDVGFAQLRLVVHHHHGGLAAVDVLLQDLDFHIEGLMTTFIRVAIGSPEWRKASLIVLPVFAGALVRGGCEGGGERAVVRRTVWLPMPRAL